MKLQDYMHLLREEARKTKENCKLILEYCGEGKTDGTDRADEPKQVAVE